MAVQFFRQRRAGPELEVEDAVVGQIPDLFRSGDYPLWMGGSLPIGAGRPDLVVISCEPKVYALAQVAMPTMQILAYLRAVGRARPETISERLGRPMKDTVRCLEGLREVEAVRGACDVYFLSPGWRDILPEIVTIEAKVADWRKAVSQAGRNRVFAHRSFVALPNLVAERVRREPVLTQLGIGVLSVGQNNEVRIAKQARHRRPRVWTYYYQLAHIVASHPKGVPDAVCCVS
ncbi:MAG: hypothetical protein IMZ62_00935 [Chloroflexi bacterium]|nr:hypothetical protein [Chloroflexota bacterium]